MCANPYGQNCRPQWFDSFFITLSRDKSPELFLMERCELEQTFGTVQSGNPCLPRRSSPEDDSAKMHGEPGREFRSNFHRVEIHKSNRKSGKGFVFFFNFSRRFSFPFKVRFSVLG